ncbi:MAG: CehA/McbA family metallohydrolase [Candidatus Bathyarchaeia archaeon]
MELKLDLHVHTKYSRDCKTRIEDVVTHCHAEGLDGYALADHDTVEGFDEALNYRDDLIVIPGLEVTSMGGHVLALGVKRLIPPRLSIKETVERIHQQSGVAVLAHPYGVPRSWVNTGDVEEAGFDAIEVANAAQFPYSYIRRRNQDLADRLGLPTTGGSDSHIPETIGRCYTLVESRSRKLSDVLESIASGYTEVYGTGITVRERVKKLVKDILR